MKSKLFNFICIWLICSPLIDGEEQIRYAAVIYRHGDRTPVNQFPNDPYKNESLWPVRFGQLTNIGKRQHYELGKWFRERYNPLLSEKFDPEEINVCSTNVDRTLMSAATNLAGMYPPVKDAVWNPKVNWQPVPIHTKPEEDDEVLAMGKKCPNYEIERIRVRNSPAYKNRLAKYDNLMRYLTLKAGTPVEDYDDINNIYSVLKIEELYNFTLPGWATAVYPGQMMGPAGYSFRTGTATPLMARLKIGPFLKEVLTNMAKTMHFYNSQIPYHDVEYDDVDGTPPRKLDMYSAHDLNIGNILNGLGMFDGVCPEYTSTIMFELVYDDSVQIHFVKILYRNTTEIKDPLLLNIPKCGQRCPLERFMELYAEIIPENWNNECFRSFPMGFSVSSFIILVVCVCAYICHTCVDVWPRAHTRRAPFFLTALL